MNAVPCCAVPCAVLCCVQVPRDGFYTASMSGVVSSQLGPFGHKPEVLSEMLAGRRVMLSPSEGAYGRHVKGSASPHDLEAACQLLHLLFTQPPSLEPGEMDSVMVQVGEGVGKGGPASWQEGSRSLGGLRFLGEGAKEDTAGELLCAEWVCVHSVDYSRHPWCVKQCD